MAQERDELQRDEQQRTPRYVERGLVLSYEELIALDRNNDYFKFIEECRQKILDPKAIKQTHHIIPKHMISKTCTRSLQFRDSPANLIVLSIQDHITAHQLLFSTYESPADNAAALIMEGRLEDGLDVVRSIAHQNMRRNQTGFFNSELQSELGRRPKKPRTFNARNQFIMDALLRGFSLEHVKTGDIIKVEPGEVDSITEVIEKLMASCTMEGTQEKAKWDDTPRAKKYNAYPVTACIRSMTGHIDYKGKSVYTFQGWRILGINIQF